MGEPTLEQPTEPKRSILARALAASVRQPGEKMTLTRRILTASLAVVLAGAVALGVGALVFHKKPGRTVNAANAQRSASPTATNHPQSGTSGPAATNHPKTVPVYPPRGPSTLPGGQGNATRSKSTGTHGTSGATVGTQAVRNTVTLQAPIASYASGRCIDVTNGNSASGTPLQIWDCNGVAWQKWSFESDGTIRTLGKCMALSGGSSANGTPIVIEPCNGGAAQRFVLKSSLDLVNIAADKCVDVKDQQTANGTRLQLWDCGGTSNQKWHTV